MNKSQRSLLWYEFKFRKRGTSFLKDQCGSCCSVKTSPYLSLSRLETKSWDKIDCKQMNEIDKSTFCYVIPKRGKIRKYYTRPSMSLLSSHYPSFVCQLFDPVAVVAFYPARVELALGSQLLLPLYWKNGSTDMLDLQGYFNSTPSGMYLLCDIDHCATWHLLLVQKNEPIRASFVMYC